MKDETIIYLSNSRKIINIFIFAKKFTAQNFREYISFVTDFL
jgi:hypothetical protein